MTTVTELSEYLAEATHQAISAEVVAKELRMHVDHLLAQVDAYAAEDYERAFQLERETLRAHVPAREGARNRHRDRGAARNCRQSSTVRRLSCSPSLA